MTRAAKASTSTTTMTTVKTGAKHTSVAAFLVIVFSYLYNSGLLHNITRPPSASAITADIKGGRVLALGDTGVYRVKVNGGLEYGNPKWSVIAPPQETGVEGSIKADSDFRYAVAEFTPTVEGEHVLTAAIPGPGMTVADAQFRIKVVPVEFDNHDPAPTHNDPNMPPQPAPVPLPATPTVADYFRQALADVHSDTYADDVRAVAGYFRATSGRAATGLLQPHDDVVAEIIKAAQLGLGEDRYQNWALFFSEVQAIVNDLRDQGKITDAPSAAPILAEMAEILSPTKKVRHP